MNTVNMKNFLKSYQTGGLINGARYMKGFYKYTSAPIPGTNPILSQEGYIPLQIQSGNDIGSILVTSTFKKWANLSSYPNLSGGIYLGSGSTPATENDLGLESPLSTFNTSSETKTITIDPDDEKFYLNVKSTITNTADNSITISEIGLFASVSTSYFYSQKDGITKVFNYTSGNVPILLDRVVLDDPIVIPSGEAAVIEYNLTIDSSNM